jgi:hypothetical protein
MLSDVIRIGPPVNFWKFVLWKITGWNTETQLKKGDTVILPNLQGQVFKDHYSVRYDLVNMHFKGYVEESQIKQLEKIRD